MLIILIDGDDSDEEEVKRVLMLVQNAIPLLVPTFLYS